MKPAAQLAAGAAAVALALAAGYFAGTRNADHPAPAPATSADATAPAENTGDKKILYYRNPMGLPDTSPEPKKDAMGMDYIPVYEGEDDGADDTGAVTVSPSRLQTLGVRTAIAELRALDEPVRVVGRVAINERTTVDVAPRFEGWIERLHVSASGDPVRRGQALFSVYSPELVSAGSELQIAERLQRDAAADPEAAESARRLADATRARVSNWQMKLPEGAKAGNGRLTFTSPANGIVLEKKAVEGMRFMPGEALYRIADLSSVWVLADVYERDLARVKPGQSASVTLDAFPGRSFPAKVAYLYPTLDAATRTVSIRLELANPEGLLRPGLFAHAEVATGKAAPVLTIPASAMIDSGERQVVLVAQDEGRFLPKAVKVGRRGSDHIEIIEGIAAGERVVVSANFLIDAESNLRAALATFTAGKDGGAAVQHYSADGTLDAIDTSAGTVSITHGAIPALKWPPMTMDFNLASPEVVKNIAPGTPIRFEFEQRTSGEFTITRIEPAAVSDHKGH
ncbi:cation efflux system transmembrane protein, resistance-nodulation-division (RND) family [Azoarcus sp. CIB]|uniref:efflux RND transporter periplasmic adaptor subunit n=1 Tax=Aromatoleum sp. (strain CIB) TaxID=198107 RepID=UPI00067BE462|nr:efflux RND transporter periplasmic adaptor subunit [Azoarcus sp. CIB]AKU13858.1 cation efflux system transmembrane protein, resistance-nodulation-division (RND) family [Azoarcus sp. CIB]